MANVLHSAAAGIHPGAYHQSSAPSSPADGILWVDTSSGPPYTLKVWKASASAWQQVGLSAGGGGADTILTTFTLASDLNVSPGADTWTDLGISFSFTVTNASALIVVPTTMNVQGKNTGAGGGIALRWIVDPAGAGTGVFLSGNNSPNAFVSASAGNGPLVLSGLSAASHTLKVQCLSAAQSGQFLCRPVTHSSVEFFIATVIQQ